MTIKVKCLLMASPFYAAAGGVLAPLFPNVRTFLLASLGALLLVLGNAFANAWKTVVSK